MYRLNYLIVKLEIKGHTLTVPDPLPVCRLQPELTEKQVKP